MSDERRTNLIIPVPLKRAARKQAEAQMITLTDAVREALMAWLTPETRRAMRSGAFDHPDE